MRRIVGIALISLFTLQCKTNKSSDKNASRDGKQAAKAGDDNKFAAPPADINTVASQIQQVSQTYGQSCDSSQSSCQIAQGLGSSSPSDIASNLSSITPADVATGQQAVADGLSPAPKGAPEVLPPLNYTAAQIGGIAMMIVGGIAIVGGLGAAGYHAWANDYRGWRTQVVDYWNQLIQNSKSAPKQLKDSILARMTDGDKIAMENGLKRYTKAITAADFNERAIQKAQSDLADTLYKISADFSDIKVLIEITDARIDYKSMEPSVFKRVKNSLAEVVTLVSEDSRYIDTKNNLKNFAANLQQDAKNGLAKLPELPAHLVVARDELSGAFNKIATSGQIKSKQIVKGPNFSRNALIVSLVGGVTLGGGIASYVAGTPTPPVALNLANDESFDTYVSQMGQFCADVALCQTL